MYKHVIKRLIDLILSSVAIIVLALPMLIIAIAIKIDDPGPVLFKQKRVGKKKNGEITYFMIWKFRSMKMSTPHDTPTHLLENPEQYITRVGRFNRKTSLDDFLRSIKCSRRNYPQLVPDPPCGRKRIW